VVTIETVVASITGDMMGYEDPIPNVIISHILSNLHDFSCDLMAKYSGCFFDSIPLHDITATDPTG
jgi:hypothetical protein